VIDGKVMRTGSANFSTSAERYSQQNDLIIQRNPEAASHFENMFGPLWSEAEPAEGAAR
jgi:phosphatidylserine/phosphatidylglycerophosphate/cardiolipin synthase-like enzyme